MHRDTQVRVVDEARVEYRFRAAGSAGRRPVVLLPGAHMSAATPFEVDRYVSTDRDVLVVSRPGYGRTDPAAGPGPGAFAHRVAGLCRSFGWRDVTAIGVSMGARTAVQLAADQPDLVARLVLSCPVSSLPWPDPRTRRTGRLMFGPVTERATWALLHTGLRRRPGRFLRIGVASLSSLPPEVAVRRLGADVTVLVTFLQRCRSQRGFTIDLRPAADDPAPRVRCPTLVLSSRHDGSVAAEHAEHLAGTIAGARHVDVGSPTHILWLGDRAEAYAELLATFDTG